MANLLDAIGGGLLNSDYMRVRSTVSEINTTAKNLLGLNDSLVRAPMDKSLSGVMDPILRKLPPSLRDDAKRVADIEGYLAIKKLKGAFDEGILSINKEKAEALKDKIESVPDVTEEVPISDSQEDYGQDGEIGKRPRQPKYNKSAIRFTEDDRYQDKTGVSGYKVTVIESSGELNSSNLSSSPLNENKFALKDRTNVLKFRPREETLWYISLDRYTEGVYPTALPELPTFNNEFSEESINYQDWIPATSYEYDRRDSTTMELGPQNLGISQVTGLTRGRKFSIDLEDDRDHSLSRYAKEVINLSVGLEDVSITYWECLIHKINLFILDRQWRVIERFTLLGILTSDGATKYEPDMKGSLRWEFNIVGELTTNEARYIEEL